MMRREVNQISMKLFFALLACWMFAFGGVAAAQSGRKAPKRTAPPPVAAPATVSSANDPQPLPLPIVVTKYVAGVESPLRTRIVADAVLERLQKSKAVTVRSGGELNRAEARKRAQADSKTYIVWVWLEPDVADTQRAAAEDERSRYSRSLVINYIIFTPGSGEIKTQGRVYQRTGQLTATSGGRIGVSTGRIADEFLLREAGIEAADRILSELDLAPAS